MLETERGRPRPLVLRPRTQWTKRDGTRTPSSARTEAAAHKGEKRRNADALVRSYGGPPAHKGKKEDVSKIDFALRLLCELGVLCVKTSI